jgi:hypothetical protein
MSPRLHPSVLVPPGSGDTTGDNTHAVRGVAPKTERYHDRSSSESADVAGVIAP